MIYVSLVGNPNTGKTTLFNNLTASHEHVGNWHGVTVEEKSKVYKFNNQQIEMVDLPGIYSLSPYSYEEEVSCRYLYSHTENIVVNIADASNLQRNLYLTLCLIEMGVKVVLVINQIDKRSLCKIDINGLSKELRIPVLHINAGDKQDAERLNNAIVQCAQKTYTKHGLSYLKGLDLQESFAFTKDEFLAIKLYEDDPIVRERFPHSPNFEGMDKLALARYDYIDKLLVKYIKRSEKVYGESKLDCIFLNKFLAFPLFLCMLSIAFYLTFFSVGKWLSVGVQGALDYVIFTPLLRWLSFVCGYESWIFSLFENALVGGVGLIVSFLPQVALLFFFLSLLEDSGYLSRIAFLFDDILSKAGLSGKAVYTLLMGFGCSTSAVLTSRNMEDKNGKIKTALLTPYMSCSAKFPIYAVLGGAFFGAKNIWVILALYLLGVMVAVFMSFILDKTIFKSKEQSFVLEFPAYRMISFKRTCTLLWQNVKTFISRVGTVIMAMNVIVFILSNFSIGMKYVGQSGVSILETLGRVLAPIFIPLGFGSWGAVSALIAGLIAKEAIVSSIAMFNGVAGTTSEMIGQSVLSLSAVVCFATNSSMLSFLVFCLLYTPCFATISVLAKEIGGKWTLISVIIQFIVAYLVSFVVYTLGSAVEIYGFWWVGISFVVPIIIGISIWVLCKRFRCRKVCPYGKNCNRCKSK